MENKNNQKGVLAYQVLGWIFLAMFFLTVVSVVYYRQAASIKVDTTLINHRINAGNKDLNIIDYQGCLAARYAVGFSNPETCNLPDGRIFFNPNKSAPAVKNEVGEECSETITSAKDPKTNEIKIFPTVCNIPVGWILIK